MKRAPVLAAVLLWIGILACQISPNIYLAPPEATAPALPLTRLDSIPARAVKGSPADDPWPPVATAGWSRPEPLAGPINTAGAEDSPYLADDGQSFYFFFTPDANLPPEKTILDGVTGIWVSRLGPAGWLEPERVPLAAAGETHLDGCEMVIGDRMYFCSIRTGNLREIDWWIATQTGGGWSDIRNGGEWLNGENEIGELHITEGYGELYFGSKRNGGFGETDLWAAPAAPEGWGEPRNLGAEVNSAADESRPFVTADGKELWFTLSPSRSGNPGPAVVRCLRQKDGAWGGCAEIVSRFAGEPNLSADGNTLYFVHHFYSADMSRMIEADIYLSRRLTPPS